MIGSRTAVVFLVSLALASCSPRATRQAEIDDHGSVGPFVFTSAGGRSVRSEELAGKVWVASFVFTRCSGPCPQVSAMMARLQHELADCSDVRLVTFTVDPDHDKPEVLARYAETFGADPERWIFLTGPRDELYQVIRKGFHLAVDPSKEETPPPGEAITHSSKLVVVDRRGHIRGYYSGAPEAGPVEESRRVVERVMTLLDEPQ